MRLGEIASSAKYRMDEQFPNLPIFGAKFWFSQLEKKFYNFKKFSHCKILEFRKSSNFHYLKMSKIEKKIINFIKFLNF